MGAFWRLKPVAMDQADDAESSLILCDNSAAVDGKDDDHGRYNLRCVLAAAAYNYTSRRLASNHMEASVDCFVSRYLCSPYLIFSDYFKKSSPISIIFWCKEELTFKLHLSTLPML